jgi:hypothetical protein
LGEQVDDIRAILGYRLVAVGVVVLLMWRNPLYVVDTRAAGV